MQAVDADVQSRILALVETILKQNSIAVAGRSGYRAWWMSG